MAYPATRPPWLYGEQELEKFVEKHNPSLNISDLRLSRNNCQLVNNVLEQIVSKQNLGPRGEWEMNLARIHLAVDLQNILKRWCGIGLQKTLEGSELRNLFSSEIIPVSRKSMDPEITAGMTKMEVSSPSSIFSGPGHKTPNTRVEDQAETWGQYCYSDASSRITAIMRADSSSSTKSRPSKRLLDGVDQYQEATKMAKTDKSSFICPYYARDQRKHVECSGKQFPNPRKLKEHVWRFIKPFKCPNCGEGFGREKTRAIHFEQRKTKCTRALSSYEGSPEYHRDQRIGAAKNTQEMIEIFEAYEKEKEYSPSHDLDSVAVDNSSEYRAEERSSSPESQNNSPNDSLENASDGELDSRVDEYTQLQSGITPDVGNHYTTQQRKSSPREAVLAFDSEALSPHTPEGGSRNRRLSLGQPDWGQQVRVRSNSFGGFDRIHSTPSFPPTSSDNFTQLHDTGLPEIVITEVDLESPRIDAMDSSIHTQYQDSQYCYSSSQGERENSYSGGAEPAAFVPGARELPNSMMHGGRYPDGQHVSSIKSGGFGGFGPFFFNMNMGDVMC